MNYDDRIELGSNSVFMNSVFMDCCIVSAGDILLKNVCLSCDWDEMGANKRFVLMAGPAVAAGSFSVGNCMGVCLAAATARLGSDKSGL